MKKNMIIELYCPDSENNDYNWGQIKVNHIGGILIGMYEGGKIARQLFYINKEQTKQLADTLLMLAENMEE